jgi:hypothetical protein
MSKEAPTADHLARFAGGAPANPAIEIRYSTGPGPTATSKVYHTGLTKRELFAAMAMQGALGGEPGSHLHYEQLARDSVAHADALLKELAK